jgi:ABC-type amino acid transport substrate-binding protein
MYLAVPPDSDIHTIKDLKGRKVALFRGDQQPFGGREGSRGRRNDRAGFSGNKYG